MLLAIFKKMNFKYDVAFCYVEPLYGTDLKHDQNSLRLFKIQNLFQITQKKK